MYDSKLELETLKILFKENGIEISAVNNLSSGFEIYKFTPDIKLSLTFINKPLYENKHPSNYYETVFLKQDFYYNQFISYRFDKNVTDQEANLQTEVMLSSVLKIVKHINKDALLTGSGGEEKLIFINQEFLVESSYYEYLNSYYKSLVKKYDLKKFKMQY